MPIKALAVWFGAKRKQVTRYDPSNTIVLEPEVVAAFIGFKLHVDAYVMKLLAAKHRKENKACGKCR